MRGEKFVVEFQLFWRNLALFGLGHFNLASSFLGCDRTVPPFSRGEQLRAQGSSHLLAKS
jgi:hypothetical protein